MEERDHKAMNEELNQPSCLGAVSASSLFKEIRDNLVNHIQQKYPNIIVKNFHSKEEETIYFLIYEIAKLKNELQYIKEHLTKRD